MEKKCFNCNMIFECENSVTCWCTNILKIPKNKILDCHDCLCKDCLLKKIKNL